MHAGADKKDDSVRLGQTYTYTWHVRERSGPGPKDPSSVVWMYHSHHSEVQDTNTGLYGAMIISAQVTFTLQLLLQLIAEIRCFRKVHSGIWSGGDILLCKVR